MNPPFSKGENMEHPEFEIFKGIEKRRDEFFKRFERIEELLKSIASSNQAILLQMEKMNEKK
jgi:hypothetical protein